MRTRFALVVAIAAVAVISSASTAAWAQIEKPVRGKQYPLSPAYGPWMIMVASFSAPHPGEKVDGMTPQQAADELVFELRSNGIPAYTYSLGDKVEAIETFDRLGEPDKRVYAAQRGSICVLAGNYTNIDPKSEKSKVAIDTLNWIKKKFQPKFLSGGNPDRAGMVSLKNGGNYRITPGQSGPLAGAFFTTNPLRSPDELPQVNSERIDLLVKLNAGGDCSLYENKSKYTLIVASFYGQKLPVNAKPSEIKRFNETFGRALDQAGQDAWELARYMRQLGHDAYVWHDEYKSVVTVGAFDNTDDPRIRTAINKYAAKTKTNEKQNRQILAAEYLTLPAKPTPQDPIRKTWIFDPQPRLMKVPKR